MPIDLLSKMFFRRFVTIKLHAIIPVRSLWRSDHQTLQKELKQIHNCQVFTSKKNQNRHIRSLIAKICKTKNYVLLVRKTQHVLYK